MKTVLMTVKQAEWAGMAPAVAGGWVATSFFFGEHPKNPLLALVPDHWDEGREISVDEAINLLQERERLWRGIDNEMADDAVKKIDSLKGLAPA